MNREFMNRELLEARGWKYSYEFQEEMHFEKGDVWADDGAGAFLIVNIKDSEVKIVTTDKGFNMNGPNTSFRSLVLPPMRLRDFGGSSRLLLCLVRQK